MLPFLLGLSLLGMPERIRSEVNAVPKALMPLLVPATASRKVKPNDFKEAQERMIRILEFLEKHDGRNGQRAKDIVTNAFYIYDRHRFSGQRRMMTGGAILRNWEKAQELGLFTEAGKFQRQIRKGSEKKKTASFEYIVPPEKAPIYSTDLANLRLVTPGERKKKGAEPTPWDSAYLDQLDVMKEEVLHGRFDDLGRTKAENVAIWKAELKRAGGEKLLEQAPAIRHYGRIKATPSGMSGNRWQVSFETLNLTTHPTEVTVEYYVFGITGPAVEDRISILARKTETLKMRSLESHELDLFTAPRTGGVRMRGWVIRTLHQGKEVGFLASQSILHDYVSRADSLPKVGAPKKRKRRGSGN